MYGKAECLLYRLLHWLKKQWLKKCTIFYFVTGKFSMLPDLIYTSPTIPTSPRHPSLVLSFKIFLFFFIKKFKILMWIVVMSDYTIKILIQFLRKSEESRKMIFDSYRCRISIGGSVAKHNYIDEWCEIYQKVYIIFDVKNKIIHNQTVYSIHRFSPWPVPFISVMDRLTKCWESKNTE